MDETQDQGPLNGCLNDSVWKAVEDSLMISMTAEVWGFIWNSFRFSFRDHEANNLGVDLVALVAWESVRDCVEDLG